MNKERNLIENKSLINTCKRLKFRSYLNKRTLRGKIFFLLKYKNINLFKITQYKRYTNYTKILSRKLILCNLNNLQAPFVIKVVLSTPRPLIYTILNFIK